MHLGMGGFPIRTPPDQSCYSAPRRLSRSMRPSSAKQAKASTMCVSLHTKLLLKLKSYYDADHFVRF